VTPENTVRNPLTGEVLPETCLYVLRTGKPCPSCGITRSMISAAHGDFERARAFHRGGIPLVMMLLAQCAMRILFLWSRLRVPVLDVIVSIAMAIAMAWLLNGW
jgi:hypothetical protein